MIYLLLKIKKKELKYWFKKNEESFSKTCMVIAELSYNGKLKLMKAEKKMSKLTWITIRNNLF